jgi:C-methyltransferase
MEVRNQLKSFFTEHWKYMAVNSACKLNVFDSFQVEKTITQVADELNLKEDKLTLLVNALHKEGFLTKNADTFVVNELSELLTDNHSESLKYACLNWSSEHLTAWQDLDYSIRTGKSAFEKVYGKPFFDYLNDNPEKLDAYHKAMYQYAKEDYKNLPNVIDFNKHKSIMDVGGSYGALLETIQNSIRTIKCVLFDLEKVIEKVKIQNIEKVAGSFFNSVPSQSDAIILSRILHDWDDNNAKKILENCFKALPNIGKLYIIENCSDKIKVDLSLLSLNMTVMCESYERTSIEYISLAENVGFQFESEIQLNELQTILIFKK